LYISEGASVIEVKDNNKIENKQSTIFVSKNTFVYKHDDSVSVQFVFIEPHEKSSVTKKLLVSIPKPKKIKSERVAEPIRKSNFNFASGKSNSIFQMASAKGNIAVSNTNLNTKALLVKSLFFTSNKIVKERLIDNFCTKENIIKKRSSYYSTRPPPLV